MTDDRVAGTVRNIGGRAQEEFAKGADDAKAGAKALATQAGGAMQDAYGHAVDAVTEGADTVKQAAIGGHDYVKKFVEENPHTASLIAIGIGVFIGYAAYHPSRHRSWWDYRN